MPNATNATPKSNKSNTNATPKSNATTQESNAMPNATNATSSTDAVAGTINTPNATPNAPKSSTNESETPNADRVVDAVELKRRAYESAHPLIMVAPKSTKKNMIGTELNGSIKPELIENFIRMLYAVEVAYTDAAIVVHGRNVDSLLDSVQQRLAIALPDETDDSAIVRDIELQKVARNPYMRPLSTKTRATLARTLYDVAKKLQRNDRIVQHADATSAASNVVAHVARRLAESTPEYSADNVDVLLTTDVLSTFALPKRSRYGY